MLVRYGLLAFLNKDAIKRVAHFPPMIGAERAAFWIYQISTIAVFITLLFLRIQIYQSLLSYISLAVYVIGLLLLILSIISFAAPAKNGINQNGLYRLSRNPIYVAYFIYFIGCAMLTRSLIIFGLVLIFQVSAHWIILSEERWCTEQFGTEYLQYMKKVRRYI